MSSLRHSVLEKSLKRSLKNFHSENSVLSDSNISDFEQPNTSRDTPGLSSKSSARVRPRNSKAKKKKTQKENILDEHSEDEMNIIENPSVPVKFVQETDIENLSKNNSTKKRDTKTKKNTSAMPVTFIEENSVASIREGINEVVITKDVDCSTHESAYSKLTRQQLIDMAEEYQYKYERLVSLVDQLKETALSLTPSHEENMKSLQDVKNKLQADLYESETERYLLEEKVQKLTEQNEQLASKTSEYEENKQNTRLQDHQPNDTQHQISIPQSPRALSRMRRRSLINQTMSSLATQNDLRTNTSLYEDVIMDQQDLLDFYSILTGVSIWKNKSSADNNDEEEVPSIAQFKSKLQVPNSKYDGIQFDMSLDFDDKLITVSSLKSDVELPILLQNTTTYDADEGYIFIKRLLEMLW